MLSFTGGLKVYVVVQPQDMRKSFNGLAALVSDHLHAQVNQGALYVFTNRRRNRLKILFWDGTGLWVCAKRLEQGRFSWPQPSRSGQKRLSLTPEALAMLTDGIELRDGGRRAWYERVE